MTTQERIKNRRIGIIGMARSGMAAARLAAKLGGQVFVSDSSEASKLTSQVAELKQHGIPYETGKHTEQLLECDYFVVSPGVPLNIDIINKAREMGIPVFSEIEFGYWVCEGTIIAITGSNGKTTTTTLIGEIFKEAGYKTFVCGNVGRPFCEVADQIKKGYVAVLEVSTFQLETVEDFKPHVALILNLSPDHLDRHGSYDIYKALKYRIAENQTPDDFLILNNEDKILTSNNIKTKAKRLYFTTQANDGLSVFVKNDKLFNNAHGTINEIVDTADIRIRGPHNLQNAAAAVCAASIFDIKPQTLKKVLKEFSGVEHRLEKIGQIAGVNFVNDSKATNVDSVCYALRSIDTPLYLIAGGRDKGAPYDSIVQHGKGKIKSIFAIGEAREKIFEQLGKSFKISLEDTLEEAVQKAFEAALPGETVLLSPGCASFDMFKNFEDRGRAFKNAVAMLKGQANEKING